MTWQVFGGEAHELYLALLKERCEQDGLGTSEEVLARQFRLHLHRGIAYLATPHAIRSLTDLVRPAVKSPAQAIAQQVCQPFLATQNPVDYLERGWGRVW
jgi:hypothetical protein